MYFKKKEINKQYSNYYLDAVISIPYSVLKG